MFRLRRYFSIASLIAFILVTLLLGMLYRSVALRMFTELEENKNVELTQSFANSLWPELQPLIAMTESSTHVVLRDVPIVSELRQAVITQMRGLSVVKVKVYDLDGHTIFSTQIDQIGEDGSSNAGFQGALRGEIASELTHRDTFSAFEETIENQDVLSTYIPIHEHGSNSPVVGVFELYSNVTPFLAQINTTQRQLVLGVSLTLMLLYVILWLIVSRADRLIRQQHADQLAAAEEIRRQQRAVTVLQERERLAREIHDSLGQVLGYVNTQTQAARSLLTKQKYAATDTLLQRLIVVAQDAHVELRDVILQLQTGESDDQSFLPRLKSHVDQFRQYTEIDTELHVADDFIMLSMPASIGAHLFRITQEALTNIQKHAEADRIVIHAGLFRGKGRISIKDNGKGFDSQSVTGTLGHWGLENMRKRAAEIGASMQILSSIGAGTEIIVDLPPAQKLAATSTDYQPDRQYTRSRTLTWLQRPFMQTMKL
ncbi:MAG: sensor histidine kinase [Caldilineaceae bacterium]